MIRCPRCGTMNSEDSKFCKGCGTPVTVSKQPPPNVGVSGNSQEELMHPRAFRIFAALGAVGLIVLVVAYGL